MKKFIIYFLCLICFSSIQAADELANSQNAFAIDLYKQLAKKPCNLFFSPFSISTVFNMAAHGAQGATRQQMNRVLHVFDPQKLHKALCILVPMNERLEFFARNTDSKESCQLTMAHALWYQKDFEINSEYAGILESTYLASSQAVDFVHAIEQSVANINQWADQHTQGKIPQLLSSADVTRNTAIVLTSAIHMKGNWMHEFDEQLTAKGTFHLANQTDKEVDMMHKTARFPMLSTPAFDLLEMPYFTSNIDGPALTMLVFLPRELDGIVEVEKEISASKINWWLLNMKSHRVHVALPKFKMEQSLELVQTMQEMGMHLPFSYSANFKGIGKGELFISKAIHKSFISVDEKGTEAAAATGLVLNLTAAIEHYILEFNVDRPFLFLIMEKTTGTILFMGKIMEP